MSANHQNNSSSNPSKSQAPIEIAVCVSCGEAKPCIAYHGLRGENRTPLTNHYCPQCIDEIDQMIDGYLGWYEAAFWQVFRTLKEEPKTQ